MGTTSGAQTISFRGTGGRGTGTGEGGGVLGNVEEGNSCPRSVTVCSPRGSLETLHTFLTCTGTSE